MKVKDWNIQALTGYQPKTTLYMDFSIADHFGILAVKDTYKNAMNEAAWAGYKFLTELVMVLNWKIWEHHMQNEYLALCYNTLWEKAHAHALNTLKGDQLKYYLEVTD